MNQEQFFVILSTYPDEAGAHDLASQLVTNKLAACVNILPKMTSIYSWDGKLQKGLEHLMIIKTTEAKRNEVQAFITAHHPYEVAEVIHLPIEGGHQPYLDWIQATTV